MRIVDDKEWFVNISISFKNIAIDTEPEARNRSEHRESIILDSDEGKWKKKTITFRNNHFEYSETKGLECDFKIRQTLNTPY